MEVSLSTLSLMLPEDATMRLEAARGVTVRVRSGRIWLTESGLPEDVFLDPGQSWRLRTDGRVVVQADAASSFELVGVAAPWRVRRHAAGAALAVGLREAFARWRRDPGWMPPTLPSALLP